VIVMWEKILKYLSDAPRDVGEKIDQLKEDIDDYRAFVYKLSRAEYLSEYEQEAFSEMTQLFNKLTKLMDDIYE